MTSPIEKRLSHRAQTASDDDAIPEGDPSDTSGLLLERLQAYKHMCGYLEDYINAVSKEQKSQAKEQEKVLKSISSPLKEGHHFEQNVGGVASLFENIRTNTQAIANLHIETSKNLTGTVLPILERLHTEIKNKNRELTGGAVKGSKAVDRARNESQKHIELLGQHTSGFDSAGSRISAANDPYIIQRGIHHRLNKQIIEENNNRQDLLSVQSSFQMFETHILQTVQSALNSFQQFMSGQADRHKAIYGDMAATAQNIPPDFEWDGFIKRNDHVLINPHVPPRNMSNITFPNQGHRSTKPLIEGSLEGRKGGGLSALKGYHTGYYAVTPAGYLHEFKDDDDFRKDPTPENSLYLADCAVGTVDGTKFMVKGKDVSRGKLGQKMAMSSEFSFKAHNQGDAVQWHTIIASLAGQASDSAPTSPVQARAASGAKRPAGIDTSVGAQQQGVAPSSATPKSAGAGRKTKSPTNSNDEKPTPTGAGSHFHGAPASNELEGRKYAG